MISDLKRTPLYQEQVARGARLGSFAGWEAALYYSSILAEHRAVRRRGGLFDVSHLSRLAIHGPAALSLLQKVLATDVSSLAPGRAWYCLLCQEDGGLFEDCLVFHETEEQYLLVGNALNTEKVYFLLQREKGSHRVALENRTTETAMLAYQGPRVASHLDSLSEAKVSSLARFALGVRSLGGVQCLVSRTGYTGEDGFELVVAADKAPALWNFLLGQGATPCGLGARDTLRLEAGFLLGGSDYDPSVNPYEAGLGRLVHLDKGDFIGRQALLKLKNEKLRRRLIGLEMVRRGIPRAGYSILAQGQKVGQVTSGSYAPTLDKNIALGYVATEQSDPGTPLEVDIRGRAVAAQVVKLPFYQRQEPASPGKGSL